MKCFSCKKEKNQIHAKNSDIIKGVTNLMCQSCIDLGYEPRWVIVLCGRSDGMESVREYIVKRKYFGDEITATELIS